VSGPGTSPSPTHANQHRGDVQPPGSTFSRSPPRPVRQHHAATQLAAHHRQQQVASRRWIGTPLDQSTSPASFPSRSPGSDLGERTLSYSPTTTSRSSRAERQHTGTGQIGVLDTTLLANGSYWVQLYATTRAQHQNNLALFK